MTVRAQIRTFVVSSDEEYDMFVTGSNEYVAAIGRERYGRHRRVAPPSRMTGQRAADRVIRLVGRGREAEPERRAA
jgi:hypothetical protein